MPASSSPAPPIQLRLFTAQLARRAAFCFAIFAPHRDASFIDTRHRASTTAARKYVRECSFMRKLKLKLKLARTRRRLNPGRAPSFARAPFVSLCRAFCTPFGRGVAPL